MTSLFLQEGKAPTVKVHPVVIFSILDHYRRRNTGAKRVVGTLLGNKVNNIIEVQACFAVPHTEEGQISIGGTYNQQMVALKTAVNNLEVVGWYATGVDGETMGFTSAILHGYYERELSIVNPIHLLVDAELTSSELSVRTFVCNTLTLGKEKLAANCQEVKTVILSDSTEKTAVDFMMKNVASINSDDNSNNNNTDPKIVENNIKTLERSITRLLNMLERVSTYVNEATNNPDKRDSSVGYLIESALSSVPRINPAQFDKMFNSSLQDMLMITYLTNLMRAQLAIADKLSDCDRLLEA
jgi:translation initiation factor 3 subunit F